MFCDLKHTKSFFTSQSFNVIQIHKLSVKYCRECSNRLSPPPRVTKVNLEDLNCNCIRYKIHATVLISAIKESRDIYTGQNAGHGNKGDVKISLKQ